MRGSRGSRLYGSGIGAQVFVSQPPPTCPAGQHWVDTPAAPIRGLGGGMGACVPNTVLHLTLRPPAAAPAPPPLPPAMMATPPSQVTVFPSTPTPTGGDAAPAPQAPAPGLVCPPGWPWWYLLIAAGVGGALGFYGERNQRTVKRNARRVAGHAANRIVNRASENVLARFL